MNEMVDLRYGFDVLDALKRVPDASLHCCVTSPPYWGLRDYGTAVWEDGDADCDHAQERRGGKQYVDGSGRVCSSNTTWQGAARHAAVKPGDSCRKCGARRIDNQLGLETSLDDYVSRMRDVFAEVRRVLHPTGTLFLNLGDTYASAWACNRRNLVGNGAADPRERMTRAGDGLKEKDLCLVPFRVALALQADGWYLRDVIVWAKKTPMPEPVQDRCTKSWEPVFLFAKEPRYFYDAEAVKERAAYAGAVRKRGRKAAARAEAVGREPNGNEVPGALEPVNAKRNLRNVWTLEDHAALLHWLQQQPGGDELLARYLDEAGYVPNVWTLAHEPYKGAHFATFPTEIPRRCILAGTSERGCCPSCLNPYRRVVEKRPLLRDRPNELTKRQGVETVTTGWEATCDCDAGPPAPCRVLDPFSGSGTTGQVALSLGRAYLGIDLNRGYLPMAQRRIGALFCGGADGG